MAATVDEASATLEGSLDELPGAGVAVGFEYRPVGADDWETTATCTRSRPCTVSRSVEDLSPGTSYEFRTVATAGNVTVTGSAASFSTAGSPAPVVDRYEVVETAAPAPDAEVTVEWTVSGDDLSTVLVKVVDDDGWVLDATRSNVSGGVASGVDYFRIPDVGDATIDAKLTVADDEGNTTGVAATATGRSD